MSDSEPARERGTPPKSPAGSLSGAPADGVGRLSELRLDDLLVELQVRMEAVRGARDRVHRLLEAVLSVGRELDLAQVLRGIVEAATVLVDAEYGALGVIGDDRMLSEFVPVGVTDEQWAAIGALPSGHGLLGELIRNPAPLRLGDLSEHPASHGFPPHHPPMHSFLGVPVRVREKVFGNLYLTEKRGAAAFDAEDELVLSTLAVAAGVAIENARLYEAARRRERWLAAGSEVTSALLSGLPRSQVLELIVEHARAIVSADLGLIAVPAEGTGRLRIALAAGTDAERHEGVLLPGDDGCITAAYEMRQLVDSADLENDRRAPPDTARWAGLGPAAAVPLRTGDSVHGVLLLARGKGRAHFGKEESSSLMGFAEQVALGMELAERRSDAEQITLLEDRDRIARDLHDLAIQRLFATGMTLQSARRFVEHPQAVERLERAVDDLDTTIKIIRSTIFGLRSHEAEPAGAQALRSQVVKAVEGSAASLGFSPALRIEGLLDTRVAGAPGQHLVAVLVEALSNVARHARAAAVDVHLVVTAEQLTLTVTDDGVGIPPGAGRSGLKNINERARAMGGTLDVGPGPRGGTQLVWRVPLPAPDSYGDPRDAAAQ
ncbi:GAF domain-containing protein [Streptomyces sp. NBC_00390]|uniref:sensor histidine kinase n=1 Tax=Streptomyces sp. NBC_00390 TaxID=2975736 RepID=UPI002E1F19A3